MKNKSCKSYFLALVFLINFQWSFSQTKNLQPDPISLIDSITSICNAVNFFGKCELGSVQGKSQISFLYFEKKKPILLLDYSAYAEAINAKVSNNENGLLRSFKYTNDGYFDTKILHAQWFNTKYKFVCDFLLQLMDNESPRKLYIGLSRPIKTSAGVIDHTEDFYVNVILTDEQFERIKKLLHVKN